MRLIGAIGLVLVVAAGVVTAQVKPTADLNPLSELKYRTAWILLGDLDLPTGLWRTSLKHVLKDVPSTIVVPRIGDVLEITAPIQPVIIDYVNRGEELRLMTPAGRVLCTLDYPDFKLSTGTLVRTMGVSRETAIGQAQPVWVRVEPVR